MSLFNNKDSKEFDKKRLEASLKICKLLTEFCEENKSLRFGQALGVLGITNDIFSEEPQETLTNIEKKLKERG